MRCHNCGASIDSGALTCPFCKTQSAKGAEFQRQQEHAAGAHAAWQAQTAAHQRNVRLLELDRAASRTLSWSIAGTVLCCLPLGIVGIVQGARARTLARELGVGVPTRGKVGFILAFAASAFSVIGVSTAAISSHYDQEDAEARVALLEKRAAPKAALQTLDQPTACALAEVHFLREGWAGHPGHSLHGFGCVGKLVPLGTENAQLEDLRFRWSATQKFRVNTCFKRGAKWYVTEAREGACPRP